MKNEMLRLSKKEVDEFYKYKKTKSGYKAAYELMLDYYKGINLYTAEEEREAFVKYKKEPSDELREEIISHYIKLVISFAARYEKIAGNSIEKDDLVQEGFFGLVTAIEKYDVDLGYRFTTYASNWIVQAITRYIDNNNRVVRVPVHAKDLYSKINNINKEREKKNLPQATNEELRKIYGFSDKEIETYLLVVRQNVISLNAIVSESDNEDTEVMHFISDDKREADFLKIEQEELKKEFDQMIEKYLSKTKGEQKLRNEDIIRRRLGLNETGEIETLENIGADYGISRERVRQIEAKFMKYLKKSSNLNRLKEFYD